MYRRLASNPGYYSQDLLREDTRRGGAAAAAERWRGMIAAYLDRLVSTSLDTLLELNCISLRLPRPEEEETPAEGPAAAAAAAAAATGDEPPTGLRKAQLEQLLQKQQQQEQPMFEPIIEATPLGRIACLYYIKPSSARMLQDKMQPEGPPLSFVDLLRLLSDVHEFAEMPLRYSNYYYYYYCCCCSSSSSSCCCCCCCCCCCLCVSCCCSMSCS